jgi:predicted AAA+ superfamily ATPase
MAIDSTPDYVPRLLDAVLEELFEQLPALMIVGPRAAGKTRTAERHAAGIVRLERETEAAAFVGDPDAALRDMPEPLLLDEWQVVPDVLGAVRRAVDAAPRAGRFLLTGSVRARMENRVWPATGRVVNLAMYPMSQRELLGGQLARGTFVDRLAGGEPLRVPADAPDLRGYVELALRSGFPEPALQLSGEARRAWLESYVGDLVLHDVEQVEGSLTRRRDTRRLRRYLEAYALNSAGVADHRTIYEAAQVNKATAAVYEDLFTDLLIVEQIPAWTSNRLKRLTRQPKRYLIDPALIAATLKLDIAGVMRDGNLLGRVLDSFVVAQLRVELAASSTRPRLHHLRTAQGRHEIDLIAELAGGQLIGVEIKAGGTTTPDDARHLAWLRDEIGDKFAAGAVLHTGPRAYELGDRIVAAPICALWG